VRRPLTDYLVGQVGSLWYGSKIGPTPGIAADLASASSDAEASWPFSPVRHIRAAIRPVTTGVENDVPLHFAIP
jgi:hypothetical protein